MQDDMQGRMQDEMQGEMQGEKQGRMQSSGGAHPSGKDSPAPKH